MDAIKEKISSLNENNTWELVLLPAGRKPIESKWIFKIKRDIHGNVDRYKARLVVKGYAQKKGYDYEETYAPVARLTTLRVLLAIMVQKDLIACQMDIKNAFLHGELKEEIFMKIPAGFTTTNDYACKLKKSLYGLKQASRTWNKTFDNCVKELGLQQSDVDKCLYIGEFGKIKIYLLLYIDDIIILGNDGKTIEDIKIDLTKRFHIKDLGALKLFLGINIVRSAGNLYLSQPTYLKKLLERFNMENCNPIKTPIEIRPTLNEGDIIDESKPYRELIRCLMYAMLATRPDLSAVGNHYSRHQSHPTEVLWKELKLVH